MHWRGVSPIATFTTTWLDHVSHDAALRQVKPLTAKRYKELLLLHVVPVIGPVRMAELRPVAVQRVTTASS